MMAAKISLGWELAEYRQHDAILLDGVDVVGGLVERELAVALLPELAEALAAVGVLVHADHHRQAALVVGFRADAAAGQFLLVVFDHLPHRLFQRGQAAALLLVGRVHRLHLLNVQLLLLRRLVPLPRPRLPEELLEQLPPLGGGLGRTRLRNRLFLHLLRFFRTLLQPELPLLERGLRVVDRRFYSWARIEGRRRDLLPFLWFFGKATPHLYYEQSLKDCCHLLENQRSQKRNLFPCAPMKCGYFAACFYGRGQNGCKLFIGGSMLAVRGCLLVFLMASVCAGQSCDSGSFFDGTQCVPCSSACESCISEAVCTVCKPQAFLLISKGGLSCEWCSSLVAGCAFCASESSCSVCDEGFFLSGSDCVAEGGAGGQLTIEPPQASCQSYEVSINGACYPSIPLCDRYNPDGTCSACQGEALFIQGYCIPSAIVSSIASDPSPAQPASLVCQERQFIANGECITMGPACLSFLINGTCTECDEGYTLFRGLCVQDAGSSQILISYIPTAQTDSQMPAPSPSEGHSQDLQTEIPSQVPSCSAPCATCSEDSAYCLSCLDGFVGVDELPGQCFQL